LVFFDLSFVCDNRAFIDLIQFLIVNLTEKKIPLVDDTPAELKCTVCLLPMQYQKKINDVFLWQCFKCGKKYFVSNSSVDYSITETWSSAK
jgi:hypothetical protein